MNYPDQKPCARCKQVLAISEFYLSKRGQRHSYCKQCHKEYTYFHYHQKIQSRMLGA